MASRPAPAAHRPPASTSAAVDEFMAGLVHPHKAAVAALRELVLAVDPSISEGIQWNSPSFRTTEWFATTHLRAKSGIGLILHLGAKVRQLPPPGLVIDDPTQRLKWLGPDRAQVAVADADDLRHQQPALQAVLKQWIRFV